MEYFCVLFVGDSDKHGQSGESVVRNDEITRRKRKRHWTLPCRLSCECQLSSLCGPLFVLL
jgi:hypothetical protein